MKMQNYALTLNDDLIDNPSPRCACMVVLDTSGSMDGAPIAQLNEGIKNFIAALQSDEVAGCSIDVAVMTAGGVVTEQLPFTTAMNVDYINEFSATGGTPLGQAVGLALQRLEERKKAYQATGVAYYQPWLVLISDGAPTDSWQHIAAQSRQLSEQRKLVMLPIGVAGADLNILGQFSTKPAKQLAGLKFNEFFEWLSASMSRVSASASTSSTIQLPATNSWDSI
jgi:uncharacterized protein YegL